MKKAILSIFTLFLLSCGGNSSNDAISTDESSEANFRPYALSFSEQYFNIVSEEGFKAACTYELTHWFDNDEEIEAKCQNREDDLIFDYGTFINNHNVSGYITRPLSNNQNKKIAEISIEVEYSLCTIDETFSFTFDIYDVQSFTYWGHTWSECK